MPKVGNKEFPYTREGIAAAKAEARTSGQPIKARKTYSETVHNSIARAKNGHAVAVQSGGSDTGGLKLGGGKVAPLGGAVTGALTGTAPLKAQIAGDARKPPAVKPTNLGNPSNHSGDTSVFEAPVNSPAGDGPAKKGGGGIADKAKAAGVSVQSFAAANTGHADKETRDQANYVVNTLKRAGKKKAGK